MYFFTSLNPYDNFSIQRKCIESWGGNIISINSEKESELVKTLYPDVICYKTDDTSLEVTGRGLVSLKSILNVASNYSGIITIINSDIFIDSVFIKSIENIRTDELWFGPRTDIDNLNCRCNKNINVYGYDWFSFTSDSIHKLYSGSNTFFIGEPCWDFWLPRCAEIAGFRLFQIRSEICFHQRHTQVWNGHHYMLFASALKYWQMTSTEKNYSPYEDPDGLVHWTRNHINQCSYMVYIS